jgi:hypothetical protein
MIRTFRRNGRNLALSSAGALWLGCGFPAEDAASEPPATGDTPVTPGTTSAALTRVTSCDDVLARIQQDTITRLIARAEELRQPPPVYTGDPGIIIDEVLPPPPSVPEAESLDDNPLLAGGNSSAPSDGDAIAGAGSDGSFSDTTAQVRDVDEADVIKAAGDDLFVLQGSQLVKLHAWPAPELITVSAAAVEGSPLDMFVSDGKAVVFSSVYRELTPPAPGQPYGYYYYPSVTKISVFDVEQETPALLRESYLEGYYVSSRRHGDVVRAVIQDNYKVPTLDGVYIEYFSPFGEPYRQSDIDAQVDAWLERTTWAVLQTELSDWLPRQFTAIDGELVEQEPNCSDYYQPNLDLSQSGVTQVFSLELDEDDGTSPLPAATVLARAERVYANADVVLMAQTSYGTFENNYSESTNLHRFDLDGADTVYAASGVLPGYVQSQFSLDERAGTIRVSTTQNDWDPVTGQNAVTNRVFALGTQGADLSVLGQTEVFGENEQIYATRFIGDRGYVVTFRQIDPLFVVDLADPTAPQVVGELHVPGFSNFLFPLDQDHLLAFGRDATPQGLPLGVALSIFDVSDPSAPALDHKFTYSGDDYSEANVDHRGISFHPDTGRIAFPLYDYTTGASTIEVFDVDAESGFARRGSLQPDVPEYSIEECVILLGYGTTAYEDWVSSEIALNPSFGDSLLAQCRGIEQMRRGLFREDFVYGVSSLAVYAQDVDDLDEPSPFRASLPPAYYYDYYPTPGVIAGTGGAAGAAGAAGSAGAETGGAAGAAGAAGAGGAPAEE